MTDPAKALLAEALTPLSEYIATISSQRFGFDPERVANDLAATGPGTRLLAALRDGLAVERLPKGHSLYQFRDGAWVVRDDKHWDLTLAQPTPTDAVAAALAPETSDV